MARSKDQYIIDIHYPKTKDDMYKIRKRMGTAYNQFVKDYILTLPVSDEIKNEIYEKVIDYLNKYK